jgi:ABC-type polysaccharide/polyol phosphate transport system ATPase subunit
MACVQANSLKSVENDPRRWRRLGVSEPKGLVAGIAHANLREQIAALRHLLSPNLDLDADACELTKTILQQVSSASVPDLIYWPTDISAFDSLLQRRVPVPSDKLPSHYPAGFEMSANRGERARLMMLNLFSATSIVVHAVLSISQFTPAESPVALRWTRGNDAEETIVQFGCSRWILNSQVPFAASNQPYLVSIFYAEGELRLFIDGVLVFWRPSRRDGAPDGLCLDVIGTETVPASLVVHGLLVEPAAAPSQAFDMIHAPSRAVMEAVKSREVGPLSTLLHALELAPLVLGPEEVEEALDYLQGCAIAYPEHVVTALRARIPKSVGTGVRTRGQAKRPAAVICCEHVAVEVASNPAARVSWSQLLRPESNRILRILDGVNFAIYPRDIVGVIGRNGAGKSTLLRTFIGAMPITSGRIGILGKPALLRPGGGMQPELTGLQNIMKAGLYMGLTPAKVREIAEEVIDFSELGDHIHRPFRYYSDGMRSRLIFALATSVPQDILMLDELLSAGDAGFQRKAMTRLEQYISMANTVIVVQHTFEFILSKCTKCLYLKNGRQEYFGDPGIAIELYKSEL